MFSLPAFDSVELVLGSPSEDGALTGAMDDNGFG